MFTVKRLLTVVLLTISMVGIASAGQKRPNSLNVTATAYNSVSKQTDSTPDIAAWGDRLTPGMKAIAISRDLLKKHGLSYGDKVKIKSPDGEYLDGEYVVMDKMHSRWRKKIDIYMGRDVHKAKRWGRRTVSIHW
ncbi:3D domain-containing protein [Thiothrix subterranea]|uniref:3D domain-containing protein n=1 Tax=Thiothrix subterranea TaxID=2735563 RepID=UPI00192BB025|nr:3D domain-containing protein [Thiothrix subterranea]QQZ28781.1 3D domain-containing protein [Thiothrix subterranea]